MTRLLLRIAVQVWAVPFALGALALFIAAPGLVVLGLVALVLYGGRRRLMDSWTHGSARWATLIDLWKAGVLNSPGLLVGRVNPPKFRESLGNPEMLALPRKPPWVGLSAWNHAVAFAPAGKGKSQSIIIPFLLNCADSCVVIDVKGELFRATADARRAMGHEVVCLDPFRQCSDGFDSLNVLDLIDTDSPFALDDARAMAEALVVRTGEEKEPHWNDAAEMNLAATLAMIASFHEPDDRNLQFAAEVLSSPEKRARAIEVMRRSPAWGGLLARMGDQLTAFEGKELNSTLTTTARFTRFLSSPAVVENTTTSSFDARGIVTGKLTVYLVIPPDRLNTLQGLLRLWITCLLRVLTRSGLKHGRKVRFVLDEAAALGRLDAIENAIAQLRGYGASFLFMYQSMGQLKACYREGQDQTFMSNMDVQVFFGINDYPTAEFVSKRLGKATVANASLSGGGNWSQSTLGQPTGSKGGNDGWNQSWVGRSLLDPDEVLGLHERDAVVFTPNLAPVMTGLCRSYDSDFELPTSQPRVVGSWVFAVVSITAAVVVSLAMVSAISNGGDGYGRFSRKQPESVHPWGQGVGAGRGDGAVP